MEDQGSDHGLVVFDPHQTLAEVHIRYAPPPVCLHAIQTVSTLKVILMEYLAGAGKVTHRSLSKVFD